MTLPTPAPSVTLFTIEKLQLEMVVTQPDEREPDKYVLTTFTEGRRLARRAVTLEESGEITVLVREPRLLMYVATEDDPGIQAHLFALTVNESESWKPEEERDLEATYLGTVVRATECRVAPTSLLDEAADHFASILGGKTVEPIEQLMKRLG